MKVRMEQSHFGRIEIEEFSDLESAITAAAHAFEFTNWRALRILNDDGSTQMDEDALEKLIEAKHEEIWG